MTQKTELTFIVQGYNPNSKTWSNVYYSRCGLRQREYYKAKQQALKVMEVFDRYDGEYRLKTAYLPVQSNRNIQQLKLNFS